jgi:hypothetical protein
VTGLFLKPLTACSPRPRHAMSVGGREWNTQWLQQSVQLRSYTSRHFMKTGSAHLVIVTVSPSTQAFW